MFSSTFCFWASRLTLCILTIFAAPTLQCQAVALTLSPCHGSISELAITSDNVPYVPVSFGEARGHFVVDTGDSAAAIDLNAFPTTVNPRHTGPNPSYQGQFLYSDFAWLSGPETVSLREQPYNYINTPGVAFHQAGLIGTSFLSELILTFDYGKQQLWNSARTTFCGDATLLAEGFRPLSTAGYFANDMSTLKPNFGSNIPTVPIKIGSVTAIAQLDTGYADSYLPLAVELNQPFYDALRAANVTLIAQPHYLGPINCKGREQKETHYILGSGANFSFVATDGTAILVRTGTDILVKEAMPADNCGGIASMSMPAAQLGASWFKLAGRFVLDPYSSRVWIQTPGAH